MAEGYRYPGPCGPVSQAIESALSVVVVLSDCSLSHKDGRHRRLGSST
jgi:hypothetical protein